MSNELPKPGAKLKIKKLIDPEVVLHPTISKWRNELVFDPLLYKSLGETQIAPIVFRQLGEKVELLAGSRRYFHQKLRGVSFDDLHKDVRENVSDRDALLLAASENIFREDFSPWEEARVINDLLSVGKMKVKDVAEHLGKSQAYVTSRRALLALPAKVQARFEKKSIAIGYAVPVKKLTKFPEAQKDLLEKIVEGGYSGIKTIEAADTYVTNLLDSVKEHEALLKAYGPCIAPGCGSKDIVLSRWGDGNRLSCNKCGHEWHKDTKEPWKFFELKQEAQKQGFNVEVNAEDFIMTPKDVVEMQERKERMEREKTEEETQQWAEKFRSPILIEEIVIPMLPGNVQKVVVDGNRIEIELIESSELYFKGLKKDYKAGEKGRIEVTYGGDKQVTSEKVHKIIDEITSASSS